MPVSLSKYQNQWLGAEKIQRPAYTMWYAHWYERKLLAFLKRINMSPDVFVKFAKGNPSAAEKISLYHNTG
jgi:hypothetical protein